SYLQSPPILLIPSPLITLLYSFHRPGPHRTLPSFPTRRSSDLGPIRIGQGVEFDYSTVHAVKTIREHGYEAIIINNNPETVSTRSEEHTSELQSRFDLVCRLLLEKKKKQLINTKDDRIHK